MAGIGPRAFVSASGIGTLRGGKKRETRTIEMKSLVWQWGVATSIIILAMSSTGLAVEVALEGRWLDRYTELKEAAQQDFFRSAPKPGEIIEFVTKNNVRQHGQLVRLESDRFIVNINGKELTYRQSFLSPESAAEFLPGPYAEAKARATVETEINAERAIQAEKEAEAARQRAAEEAAAEKRARFLNGASILAGSEGKGSDLYGFLVLGGSQEWLKELPDSPQQISSEEANAKESLWQAFTKMSSATELGVTKVRYAELLLDLKTAFKVQERKMATERFCKFRIQCILALACYIKAWEAWESYFQQKGSDKKVFVSDKDIDVLNALGTDCGLEGFKVTKESYSFYDVPYDIMLSPYWNAASRLVDGMAD